jgi:hypothetical protein
MKPSLITIVFLYLILSLPACQLSGTPIPTTSPANALSPSPSITPSSTATERPTGTNTLAPSSTLTPTVTPTITPTPIPIPHLRLVYPYDDFYWVLEPPAPPLKLAEDLVPNPDWLYHLTHKVMLSPDGAKILFLQHGVYNFGYTAEILAINFNGSGFQTLLGEQQITNLEFYGGQPDALIDRISWIPGTHRLLFSTAGGPLGQVGLVSHGNLFVLNADTGQFSRIFKRGEPGYATPSPDGKRMANIKICSVSLDSIGGSTLVKNIIPESSDCYRWHFPEVVWAEDSMRFGAIMPFKTTGVTIWSADASTGIATPIGTIDHFSSGVLSPTLDYIGGLRRGEDIEDQSTQAPCLYHVDGSLLFCMATEPGGFVSFAPDGLHFAYYVGCLTTETDKCTGENSPPELYVGTLDGNKMQIPGLSVPTDFRWINNTQFVFVAGHALTLGDIGGNFIPITTISRDITALDMVDLDFQRSI